MATEAEVLVNAEGNVCMVIAALAAAPVSYRIADPARMTLDLVCDDGSRHSFAFPEAAGDGWQKVIDNERLLVTEVNTEAEDPAQDGIVRDAWLQPEGL